MSDKSVDYSVTADPTPFKQGMEAAASAAKGGADKIKGHFDQVGKAFEEVQKKLLVISAIVAGGTFFKEAIAATNKMTSETMNLSKRLGITGAEASALNTALGDIGSDSDTYIGAFDKFAKQIKTNEQGLRDMGLQTRDANGNLRESSQLFQEALQTVGQFKPGLDQTTAAMTLFGKGVDDAMKLQKLNNDVLEQARQKNEELGLTISQEGVEASKAYKAAMNDVGDVLNAVQVNIGRAVMPVFTELGEYFASTGPYVVAVFKGAITGLLGAFEAVKAAVKTVTGVIFEAFNTIIDVGGLLGEVFSKLWAGDFSGAYEAAKGVGARMAQAWRNAFANFIDSGNEAEAAMKRHMDRIWGKGTEVAKPKGGTRRMAEQDTEAKAKKDPSFMKYYEAALEEEKRLASERDAVHGLSKEAELKYWEDLLQYAQLTETDKVAVTKKASEARIALLRDEAQQANQLGELAVAAWQARELAKVQAAEADAQLQQQLGRIGQDDLLRQEIEFEERRAQIKRTAIEANLAALDPTRDTVQVAQLNNQLEALELEHQAKLQQIRGQVAIQQNQVWSDLTDRMSGLWDKGIQAMLNGTLTFKGAMQAIFTELAGWFARAVVGEMVKKWLAGKAAQLAASLAGITAEKSAQAAGSAATVAIKATEATAVVGANAAEAASGAAASQAPIPIVGPGLAAAAFAAVLAMVMGAKGQIKSARGGMDIPAGVNPLTQLHEQEMVLPKEQANVIRDMANGGGGSQGGAVNVTIAAHPMPGNYFMVHRDQLVAAIKSAKRSFALP